MLSFAGVRWTCAWNVVLGALIVTAISYLSVLPASAEKIAQLKTDAIGCSSRKTTEGLAQAVWRGDRKQIMAIMKTGRSTGDCRQFAKETLVEILATHDVNVSRKGRRERLVALAQIRELGQSERYWVMGGQLLTK